MFKGKYVLILKCLNCDFEGDVKIKKGLKFFQVPCPECGCKEMAKIPISIKNFREDNLIDTKRVL